MPPQQLDVAPMLAAPVIATVQPPRALVWDACNTSSVLAARSLARRGWAVDWLGSPQSPWKDLALWNSRTLVADHGDPRLERAFHEHPLDALLLHGDDQVRWLLQRWKRLPATIHRHLPSAPSLEVGLSKLRSLEHARALGIPALETAVCATRAEVASGGARLAGRGHVVLKGEGGAGGKTVCAVRSGDAPSNEQWRAVTRHAPTVLVQRRLRGPRHLVSVVYERGIERAACAHEKVVAYPCDFGPTAFGVTRRVEILHDYTQRLFGALQWHGIADIEFRQDLDDGRWYFIEINPRVCATLGIQERAGMDLVATWAEICAGRGAVEPSGHAYRDGVRYAWSARAVALLLRQPWKSPAWGLSCLLSRDCDLAALDRAARTRALRLGWWMARNEASQ